ncbi:hypothetical protein EG328_008695 [Venturia inaequalis]|uniref:Elongation of fatty acids protein n=1 Tax=Venturia inaequalis TaxID=5025 RepID=A0A8H3VJ98_VENIN|nr:hypothetical protein EG328_008695 [Venturia inaequalis]
MPASFHFRMPPKWLFKFPPDEFPLPIPPPTNARTFASPFPIPADLYINALHWKVPVTIGAMYATTAIIMNKVNRDRGNKPWAFSKIRPFHWFVVAHNVFLAVFSALTFVGMLRALAHSWPGREHHLAGKYWPGMRAANGVAGASDALCKIHGPRGFGDAVYYNPTTDLWENKNKLIQLAVGGMPDSTDVGRLWNEGLAFWGWFFYLSKFYEVFDTFIILAKGKRSSTLQTYHHTGAMMCMWAGIRYMSPPIWMFCFLNSAIHTMMYVYYTLSAVGIRVPQRIKRTLTTMQISQFIIGITFAAMHLFVTYTVPVSSTETVLNTVKSAAEGVASMASSVYDGPVSTATMAGTAAWFKKMLLRAAGEEGLAENSLNSHGELFGPEAAGIENNRQQYEQHQRSSRPSWETVSCIDTTGQAFAIWLNVAYLAPLTGLFVRFFIRSYSRRGASSKNPSNRRKAEKAIQDAAHGVNQEFDSLGKSVGEGLDNAAKNIKKSNGSNGTPKGSQRRVSSSIESIKGKFEPESDFGESLQPSASRSSSRSSGTLKKKSSQNTDKLRRMFEQSEAKAKQSIEKVEQSAEDVVEEIKQAAESVARRTEQAAEAVVQRTEEAAGTADDRSSIAEEDGQDYPEARRKSLAEEIGEEHLDGESWANIKDHHEEPKEESKEERSNSTRSVTSEQDSSLRSPSPKKSKIPQPAKKESRSRSPVKPAKIHSAIPRPASAGASTTLNTNGKQQSSNSSSLPASEKDAKGVPASNNTATTKDTDNTRPFTSDSNGGSGSVHGSSGAHQAEDVKKVEPNTNVGHEQDSSASAGVDSKKQKKKNKSNGEDGVGEQSGKESPPRSDVENEGAWFANKPDDVGGEKVVAQELSTTHPKEDGASYADKIKEEGVEG